MALRRSIADPCSWLFPGIGKSKIGYEPSKDVQSSDELSKHARKSFTWVSQSAALHGWQFQAVGASTWDYNFDRRIEDKAKRREAPTGRPKFWANSTRAEVEVSTATF